MSEPIVPPYQEPTRKLPKSVLFKQRALYLYERHRGGFDSDAQFCDAFGLAYGRFRRLKMDSQVFRETLARFDVERENNIAPATIAPVLAQSRWPGLPLWKALFLETWREGQERMPAADAIGKTWSEIKRELEADQAFKAGYDEVQEELDVRVEDRFTKAAVAGKGTASQKYLDARGSELGKRGQGKKEPAAPVSPEEARKRYEALFGSVAPQVAEASREAAETAEGGSDALALAVSELAPS